MKLRVLVLRRHLLKNDVETVKDYLDTIEATPCDSFSYSDAIRIVIENQLNLEMIPLLKEKGGDVNIARFLLAIKQNDSENIQKYIKCIKDYNVFDKGLSRVINITANLEDKLLMIQTLLDAGGDIDRSHILHWAIDKNAESTELIRFILSKNPDLNTQLSGQTPLEIAQDFNGHTDFKNEVTAENLRLIQQAITIQNSQLCN